MAVYTGNMFAVRKNYGPFREDDLLELVVTEDHEVLESETGDAWIVRVDAYDNDVVFLADNPKVKFDKVEA